ncbi:hypothetical protein [Herbaspirillum sp.]|uniref:hypothetical protein n=1 Tax=Herbaspirillum sp. TaxID=1890675 RepID=UPI0031D8C7CD
MRLTVVASHAAIINVINMFNSEYHNDYQSVSKLATLYLATPTEANATPLANVLRSVLIRWGAGKRKAPKVQTLQILEATLLNPAFHASLIGFTNGTLTNLTVIDGSFRMIGNLADEAHLLEFDKRLLSVLSNISTSLLIENTNVTYPMKVLLLLTGFMPALDSQVRKGLSSAGFVGTNVTRFIMPADMDSFQARKLTRLPFYLGECFATNQSLLTDAAAESDYPWLVDEPGRLLDVLLFMQGSTASPLFLFAPKISNWHALP